MNNNTAATTTVTCPRCHGFDAFARFGHIANGKCLRCLGAKTIEVSTAKLNAARGSNAKAIAKANAEAAAKPYTIACDGCETVGSMYATWEQAREKLARLAGNGYQNRIAKWDGKCYRYRDGTKVKFGN
jgi:hypothetical protein